MDHIRRRRNLPHLETDGGIYFVTFRLADSLPRLALLRIYNGIHPKTQTNSETSRRHLPPSRLSPRVEKFLDSGRRSLCLGSSRYHRRRGPITRGVRRHALPPLRLVHHAKSRTRSPAAIRRLESLPNNS